jgi:hypothetical protein
MQNVIGVEILRGEDKGEGWHKDKAAAYAQQASKETYNGA